jgi:hypothetical protein
LIKTANAVLDLENVLFSQIKLKPMLEKLNNALVPELLDSISEIIVNARKRVVQTINK